MALCLSASRLLARSAAARLLAILGSHVAAKSSFSVHPSAYTVARSSSQYGQSSGALTLDRRSRYHVVFGSYVHRRNVSDIEHGFANVLHRIQSSISLGLS